MNNENFPHTFQKMAGQETKTLIPVALGHLLLLLLEF